MGLKKALCYKCHPSDITDGIFDVNPEAVVCYCPNCMQQLNPIETINNYDKFINDMVSKAKRVLYGVKDYALSYQMFADVIDIDPTCLEARYGRLISLIRLSTLRKEKFQDFILLLDREYAAYFSKSKKPIDFLLFLNDCSIGYDEYEYFLNKKLTYRTFFYDLDCLKLFYKNTYDMLSAREKLLFYYEKVLSKIDEPAPELLKYHQDIIDDVNKSRANMEKTFTTMEGFTYKFTGFTTEGRAMTGRQDTNTLRKPPKIIKKTLDENQKKIKVIKNKVFPDNIYLANAAKVTFPISIILFVITALLGTIYGFLINEKIAWILLILAIVALISGAILLSIYLTLSYKLKNYRVPIKSLLNR